MPTLDIDHLNKSFGDKRALDDMTFSVRDGETVSYTHLTLPTILLV